MSDTRFSMIGIGLIFAGFVTLGIFGGQFASVTLEAETFGECFEYPEDGEPIPINCGDALLGKNAFFALVVGLIGAGIFALIKGVRGRWDQDVKPEDVLGPGGSDSKPNDDSK